MFYQYPGQNVTNYGSQFQVPARGRRPPMSNQFPPTGNVMVVDNLEHALSMPTGYHSDNVYFDATQNLMYRVYTNEVGEKSYLVFELLVRQPNQEQSKSPVTSADLETYNQRLCTLENLLGVNNGKSNVTTNAGTDTAATATDKPAGQSNAQ